MLGRPTLFRPVQRLLADPRVTVDVIAHPRGYADPSGHGADRRRRVAGPAGTCRSRVGRRAGGRPIGWPRAAVRAVLDELDIAASPRLARDLVAALPGAATLVLGSSQAPRDVALSTTGRDGLRVVANRGVAGIDGTVSTAVGVALAAGPTTGRPSR